MAFSKFFLSKLKEEYEDTKRAGKAVGGLAVSALRDAPRYGLQAFTSTFPKTVSPESQSTILTPKSNIEKFIYGAEPVPTFQESSRRGEEFSKGLGINEEVSKRLGFAGAFAGLASSVIPPGGKNVGKKIVGKIAGKELTETAGKKLIKETGEEIVEKGIKKAPEIYKKTLGEKFTPKFLSQSSKVIEAQGPAGKEISRRMHEAVDTSELRVGGAVADIRLHDLTEKEAQNMKDVIVDNVKPMNDKVKNAVTNFNRIKNDIANEAKSVGLTIKSKKAELQKSQLLVQAQDKEKEIMELINNGDDEGAKTAMKAWGEIKKEAKDIITEKPFEPRENYFPTSVSTAELKKGFSKQKAIQHLIDTKQAKNVIEADKMLDKYGKSARGLRAGSLEHARELDLPEELAEKNQKDVLERYLKDSFRRLEEAKHFGAKDEKILELIQGVANEGGDYKYVERAFNAITKGQESTENWDKISSALTASQTVTKMSLSALTNAAQPINTTAIGGIKNSLKAIYGTFTKKGKDFTIRSGANIDDILETAGGTSSASKKFLDFFQFTRVEKWNRTHSALTGKFFADDMLKKAVKGNKKGIRELEKMGINVKDAVSRGYLLDEEYYKAGQNITNRAQFRTRALDLPLWTKTPTGRVLSQLKSFSFKQGQFVRDELIREAIKGNIKPLITFAVLTMVAGDAVASVKAAVRGKERKSLSEDPLGRAVENFTTVGGFGLVSDIMKSLEMGSEQALSSAAGPAATDISKAGEILYNIPKIVTGKETPGQKKSRLKGKGLSRKLTTPQREAARFVTEKIPLVGAYLKNTYLPPLNQKSTESNSIYKSGSTLKGKKVKKIQKFSPTFTNNLNK